MYKLIEKNFDVVDNLKTAPRDLSGYRMITEVKKGNTFDMMPIFLGSQGSLGVITEVILRVESLPREPKRMLSRFVNIEDVAEYAEKVKALKPLSVSLIDSRIVRIAATAGKTFDIVSKPVPGSFYVVTTFNDNFIRTARSLKAATALAEKAKFTIVEDAKNSRDFDNLNDVFDIYLNDEATRPIVTGATRVPADKLVEFVHHIDEFEEKFGRKMPIFCSILTELLEVRPSFDLASVLERKQAIMFFKDYANMIDSIGGAMAGGGAEGRTKAAVTNSRINTRERDLYTRIKLLFDPNNIMAPDIKLGATVQELVRNLRTDEIPGFIV
jgi:glycolate oxidase